MTTPGFRGRSLSLVTPAPDVSFYVQREYAKGPVLVLGAADGRVAFEIAARGVTVVGVEPSDLMLAAAETRKSEERAETASRIKFVKADLRTVRLKESFEAVIAPQNALGMLSTPDDLAAFFESARHHLRPSGTLVFDLINAAAPPPMQPKPRGDSKKVETPVQERLAASMPSLFTPHLHERNRGDSSEGIRRMRPTPFAVEDVDAALEEAGFTALERFGGFDGKPFDPTDPVQIVVAALEPYGMKH